MANCFTNPPYRLSVAAIVLFCLASATPAPAQSEAPVLPPTVLDRKKATRLVVHQVVPEYPALAKVNYIQGQVRVELLVSRDGQVAEAHVIQGHPILAASALHALRRWSYHPLLTARGAVAFLTTVNMNFTLRPRKNDSLPPQAETDLSRQVKPPEILQRPPDPPTNASVRLRVLLNDQGQIIDVRPLKGPSASFEEARKTVEQWTFRPARWGTLRVPWYLEVEVPVSDSFAQDSAEPSGQ
jgi:TonB family protein